MPSQQAPVLYLLQASALFQLHCARGDDRAAGLVLLRHAQRDASRLADDEPEVASEASALAHEHDKELVNKSAEVAAHSTEQVDKLVIETQEQAVAEELLPSATLTTIAAVACVCALAMGVWLLKRRRKCEPSTPQTPPEGDKNGSATPMATVASDLEPNECFKPVAETTVAMAPSRSHSAPLKATAKASTQSLSMKSPTQRAGSVESCHGRSSSSAWTSMFHLMARDSRKNGNQWDEPDGQMVEVMTPRQSTGDGAAPASTTNSSGRWRSVLATRLRRLKSRTLRTRGVTHCYV